MLASIGALLTSLVEGVAGPLFGWLNKKADADLAAFTSERGFDLQGYQAYLTAQAQVNQLKASTNTWGGARFMVFAFGLPAALHWGAVFFVSTIPQFGWVVPALPAAYASAEQTIALSFFILAPTMPIASAFASWVHRQ
ncbi:hypothetical protein [Methylocapsa acidiphila]|uniref:hypothetical protein n=1 Tax=Methylocapsa acidiphila TaxID=133552 RepID=UPI00041F01FB|nr:hypothetical protein [Methylocapsa acidiphila]